MRHLTGCSPTACSGTARPEELTKIVMEYMNTLLYGAWCTPAKERRRAMARFYKSGEYRRLMGFFKQNRLYEARYLPLRFHATALAVALTKAALRLPWPFTGSSTGWGFTPSAGAGRPHPHRLTRRALHRPPGVL